MAEASSNMLGVPTGGPGTGYGYPSTGNPVPGGFAAAVSSFASFPSAMHPTLENAPRVFDGTGTGPEEGMMSEYSGRTFQPGAKIKQVAKPLTYLAKISPDAGLPNHWMDGMPMFAFTPTMIGDSRTTRTGAVQPQYRAVTMLSGAQLNKILLDYHIKTRRTAILNENIGVHEDARMPSTDKTIEREQWASTIVSIGKFITYAGVLMNKQATNGTGTYVNAAKMGRLSMPNYWGFRAAKNDNIGFIIKRTKGNGESGPFQLHPWRHAKNTAPTPRELRYVNVTPTGRQLAAGIYFGVGTVLHTPMSQTFAHHKVVEDNLGETMLALTRIGGPVAPQDVRDLAIHAATVTMATPARIEVETSVVPWIRAFA